MKISYGDYILKRRISHKSQQNSYYFTHLFIILDYDVTPTHIYIHLNLILDYVKLDLI